MKKFKYGTLVVLLLLAILVGTPQVSAANKKGSSRAIGIVFDNSGSMYLDGQQAWCRATYAMEVFASMLNDGDTLQIYPMHPITVENKEYTMNNPFTITSSSQASKIRNIYTEMPLGTPIETIDAAVNGLAKVQADKKYMIVLTDGNVFYEKDVEMTKANTVKKLSALFDKYATEQLMVMYLGIGNDTAMPTTKNSGVFVKNQAKDSKDTLSILTSMCNQIFGRDSLPAKYNSGNKINFDISMSKVIVFVQGENISDLTVTGASGPIGNQTSMATTKYGTAGCGRCESVPDKSLQGVMATYTDCVAGNYDIKYSGTATSVEVYYEPDTDMQFKFTDASGNEVDPQALYEGEYKVSFGLIDGKTGEMVTSDLIGNPIYSGNYYINGEPHAISHEGKSGEVPISLKMGDSFKADMTVTYLSGYTIRKDSSDFGWPEGGIEVAARPAGTLRLEISGGQEAYSLQKLKEGAPYVLKVYYKDELLTGDELKNVKLELDESKSNAKINVEFAEDHYKLTLDYKDPSAPTKTPAGKCSVPIQLAYTAQGSDEATAKGTLTYKIEEDATLLKLEFVDPEDYFVISELGKSEAIVIKVTIGGKNLTEEQFKALKMTADCGGIQYTLIPDAQNSCYKLQFKSSDVDAGDYEIKVSASYVDQIGRNTEAGETLEVTLSSIPLWLKTLIISLIILIIIIIILIILHIKVLPKSVNTSRRESSMYFNGEDETNSTRFITKLQRGQLTIISAFSDSRAGLLMDAKPGKESYLKKTQVRRSIEVRSASVRKYGDAKITDISLGGATYVLNDETGVLERTPKNERPILLRHGSRVSYSGTMMNAGVPKSFTVSTKLNFKKK